MKPPSPAEPLTTSLDNLRTLVKSADLLQRRLFIKHLSSFLKNKRLSRPRPHPPVYDDTKVIIPASPDDDLTILVEDQLSKAAYVYYPSKTSTARAAAIIRLQCLIACESASRRAKSPQKLSPLNRHNARRLERSVNKEYHKAKALCRRLLLDAYRWREHHRQTHGW